MKETSPGFSCVVTVQYVAKVACHTGVSNEDNYAILSTSPVESRSWRKEGEILSV